MSIEVEPFTAGGEWHWSLMGVFVNPDADKAPKTLHIRRVFAGAWIAAEYFALHSGIEFPTDSLSEAADRMCAAELLEWNHETDAMTPTDNAKSDLEVARTLMTPELLRVLNTRTPGVLEGGTLLRAWGGSRTAHGTLL